MASRALTGVPSPCGFGLVSAFVTEPDENIRAQIRPVRGGIPTADARHDAWSPPVRPCEEGSNGPVFRPWAAVGWEGCDVERWRGARMAIRTNAPVTAPALPQPGGGALAAAARSGPEAAA